MKQSTLNSFINSKYFKKIFAGITFVTFSTLCVAIISLYFAFQNITVKALNQTNLAFLSKATSSIFYNDSNVRKDALSIYSSSEGIALLTKTDLPQYRAVTYLKTLNAKIAENNLIVSIYLYNGYNKTVFMLGSECTSAHIDNFFDTDIQQYLKTIKPYFGDPIRRTVNLTPYSDKTQEVYTYVYFNPTGTEGTISSAMVINVSVDKTFDILNHNQNAYGNVQNSYLVLNENHSILYSNLNNLSIDTSAESDIIQKIQKSHTQSGYLNKKIAEKSYVLTYYTYHFPEWTAINITPLNQVLNSFDYLKIMLIVILIGVLLLSSAFIFLLSLFIYSPVKKISNKLKRELNLLDNDSSDDIHFILNSISQTTTELSSLNDYKTNSINTIQKNLLKDQLLYSKYSNADFIKQCNAQGIVFQENDQYNFIYCSIDYCSFTDDDLNKNDKALITYALTNVLSELLSAEFHNQYVSMDNGNILYIAANYHNQFTNDREVIKIKSILKYLQEFFQSNFLISVSFFLSNPCPEPELFSIYFKEVKNLSNYGYVCDKVCILTTSDSNITHLKTEMLDIKGLDALEVLIKANNLLDIKHMLDKYFENLKHYEYNVIMSSVTAISNKIFNAIWSIEKSYTVSFEIDYTMFNSNISKISHLSQVNNYLYEVIEFVIYTISSMNNTKSSKIIKQIVDYIEENYTDINMSCKSLADKFNVSTGYIGRFFKQEYNYSISGYITNIRIQKSAQLLVSTNLTIEEIVDKIGWENTKYYYTQFKKMYGISPTQYRLSNLLNLNNKITVIASKKE